MYMQELRIRKYRATGPRCERGCWKGANRVEGIGVRAQSKKDKAKRGSSYHPDR